MNKRSQPKADFIGPPPKPGSSHPAGRGRRASSAKAPGPRPAGKARRTPAKGALKPSVALVGVPKDRMVVYYREGGRPKRMVFPLSAMRLLRQGAGRSGRSQGALTPEEIELLREGGLDPVSVPENNPIEQAASEYRLLRDQSYTTDQVAALLGVQGSRIRQRLASERSLYGIKVDGDWRVPRFQFDGHTLIPEIGVVTARLDPKLHPLTVSRWFSTPNDELVADDDEGRRLTPLEWLRTGGSPGVVAELAEHL